jgi:hypothetical protein
MSRRIVVIAAAALALWSCGNICDHYGTVQKELAEKVKPCADGGVSLPRFPSRGRSVCEQAIGSCSSDDLPFLNQQLDCLDKVSSCKKGEESAFLGQLAACAVDSNKISPRCSGAFLDATLDAGG